jgi:hypothetical protein
MTPTVTGPHNETHTSTVESTAHIGWGQQRAWHGTKVKIWVQTALVKDGTAAEIKILKKGTDDTVDTISGKSITGNKLDEEYEIKWKDKPFADSREFVLKASVGKGVAGGPSDPLYVDLDLPAFSA